MKVRISGYQLTYHPFLNLCTLTEKLQEQQGKRVKFQGSDRVLRVAQDDDHVLGSLLTDRGHKNFVAIHTETNRPSRGTLGEKKNLGAFSFFLLCKKKSAGIITSYRDAGGPSFVFGVLGKFGDELVRARLKTESNETGRRRKSLDNPPNSSSLDWVEVLGREESQAALKRWKRIRAVEVTFKVATTRLDFVPVGDDALEDGRIRLTFKPRVSVSRAVESVQKLWDRSKREKAETLKVDGLDEWGLSRRVEMNEKIPSLFGEIDHDKIVADPTSFGEDLAGSLVIRYLKEVARQSPAIFG
ncbi:MAG: hypothetical protein C0501_30410 [Isosphaera sp.]|nr:hypothetical protein [Isosphaera sp.]